MLISFKDWIAGRHHVKGKTKQLQEDILSDDSFPDSIEYEEMLAYLKTQNASFMFMKIFTDLYRGRYRIEVLDKDKNRPRRFRKESEVMRYE